MPGHPTPVLAPPGEPAPPAPPEAPLRLPLPPWPEDGHGADAGSAPATGWPLDAPPGSADGPPPSLGRRAADATAEWLARHRRSLVVLAPVLGLVGVVHGVGMGSYPAPVDDEGTYMAQAWSVQLHHSLTPYTYWYDHPPLGWIQIAGWTWLTDGFRASIPAVLSGRQLMLVAFLVSAGLLYVVARRLGCNRGWATVAVLAFGLSPLAVYYQRMVYLDNVATPWLIGAFALALTPRRRLWAYAASGACFAVAVLSKETLLIFAPALLWQAWQTADRRTRSFCVTAQLVVFGLLVATYPMYAVLKGELLPGRGHVSLLSAVRFQLLGRQGSGSPLDSGSAAHSQVASWLHLDPWLLAAGAVLLLPALLCRRLRPVAAAYLVGVVMLLRGGYLPVPFVIGLLPFAALIVAGVGDTLWGRAWRWTRGRRPALLGNARRLAVLAVAAAVLSVAGPAWAAADRTAMTTDQWRPVRQGEAWVEAHVPHRDRLLVDDTMWVDLVDHGFDQKLGVVWFYKVGYLRSLDPSVARRLPGGWRDFQYVVSTPSMRGALRASPGELRQVSQAIDHSVVVASFGSGSNRVQVRHIIYQARRKRAHP